jgi:tRNA:m4X modification enzyme
MSSNTITKKRSPPVLPLTDNHHDETRCQAWLIRKHKYCRQLRAPESLYCGNHFNDKSIACPLDPSHRIAHSRLQQHLKICPARKRQEALEQKSYYVHDINAGGYDCGTSAPPLTLPTESSVVETLDWAKQVALRVLQVHQRLFAGRTLATPQEICAVLLDDICLAIPTRDLSAAELHANLEQSVADFHIKSGGPKHVRQYASLIGHLRAMGALPPLQQRSTLSSSTNTDTNNSNNNELLEKQQSTTAIVEFGAGRGITGLIAAGVASAAAAQSNHNSINSNNCNNDNINNNTRLILVERGGARSKADTVLRKAQYMTSTTNYMRLENVNFLRVHCDVSHVDMKELLTNEEQQQPPPTKMIVIAKHLCGVGTDLGLKALEPVRDQMSACVFATCCHGACNWKDYVGRPYLAHVMTQPNGEGLKQFGASEFELLRRWSAGSTRIVKDASEHESELDEHATIAASLDDSMTVNSCVNMTINVTKIVEEANLLCGAQGLGRACQRLIDYGRQEYLRKVLFPTSTCEIVHYVSHTVTPQNAMLYATNCLPCNPDV